MDLKKKKTILIYNVYLMFYFKVPWLYQDFKIENLHFLNLYSVRTAKIVDHSLISNPPKGGMKDLYNSKDFSFFPEQL